MKGAASCETLRACLRALDGLLHREIFRLKARYQLSLDEFRGLYISDEQVATLARQLGQASGEPTGDLEDQGVALRAEVLEAISRHEPSTRIAAKLDLSGLDSLLLLIAAAPGIDARYETLYAYLNNDVTRKLATPDLAVRLLATNPRDTLAVRAAFAPGSVLLASTLVRPWTGRDSVPGAAQQVLLAAHAGLPDFLLGLPFKDDRIEEHIQLRSPATVSSLVAETPAIRALVERLEHSIRSTPGRVAVIEPSSSLSATAFGLALSTRSGRPLITLDLRGVPRESLRDTVNRVVLLTQLRDGVLLIEGLDALLAEGRLVAEGTALRPLLRAGPTPMLIAAPFQGLVGMPFEPFEYLTVQLPGLPRQTRRAIWVQSFDALGIRTHAADVDDLVERFQVGPEMIQAAARKLSDDAHPGGDLRVERAHLFAAARAQADSGLGRVARRVPQRHTWDDLVLPATTRAHIRSLIDALHSRERVLEEWGMARALGTVGLRALFAGPSGTGKTICAAVIARELGIDAYRVDLSQTVSKYIGETEKNLERIFQAAERAHAILFFDEADALLGKRAEVKDAHDRYANIEVAYLLQRLEEFAGIVIVATNVARNVDAAFARRMQFVIEFPLPGVDERERLWRSMFPPSAPLAADVDFNFLSRRFELAGGDIRNVALDAAFLAARHEQSIGMRHVAQALARELTKQGRSPSAADFKQHYALLDE